MAANIAKRWRELSGENHWQGLLKPLDNDLRTYLLHYGDMVSATYATFITQSMSLFAGGSMFPKLDLLAGTGLLKQDPLMKYTVTKYMYATSTIDVPGFMMSSALMGSWSKSSNWIGYIAVVTDQGKSVLGRRDIVVAWRGTITAQEWYKDAEATKVPAGKLLKTNKNPQIHQGFYSVYTSTKADSKFNKTSARDQVFAEVQRLVGQYKNEELSITVVGHSLGASLATICAAELAANGISGTKPILVTAFPFASPLTGDSVFKQVLDDLGAATNSQLERVHAGTGQLRILRIVNKTDIVPQVPPPILGFVHVGQLFSVDSGLSPYLQNPPNFAGAHDMEVYLHCIAGSKGSLQLEETGDGTEVDQGEGGFDLGGRRDIALVNKFIDALKKEHLVPTKWWMPENKGMQEQPDGRWVMNAGNWIMKHMPSQEGTSGDSDDDDDPAAAAAAAPANADVDDEDDKLSV